MSAADRERVEADQQGPMNEPAFVDTPLLQAKRKAFDYPSQGNLDALVEAAKADALSQLSALSEALSAAHEEIARLKVKGA